MRAIREKLYEEVWSKPMTVVAATYNVSANYLARVSEHLNVPRPRREAIGPNSRLASSPSALSYLPRGQVK